MSFSVVCLAEVWGQHLTSIIIIWSHQSNNSSQSTMKHKKKTKNKKTAGISRNLNLTGFQTLSAAQSSSGSVSVLDGLQLLCSHVTVAQSTAGTENNNTMNNNIEEKKIIWHRMCHLLLFKKHSPMLLQLLRLAFLFRVGVGGGGGGCFGRSSCGKLLVLYRRRFDPSGRTARLIWTQKSINPKSGTTLKVAFRIQLRNRRREFLPDRRNLSADRQLSSSNQMILTDFYNIFLLLKDLLFHFCQLNPSDYSKHLNNNGNSEYFLHKCT